MLHTRAVFLSNHAQDPLTYRILKITSGWYRKWATCMNTDLRAWISTWDCDEIYSGVPGKGGQDAWFNTALQLELAQLSNQLVVGGPVDIYKFSDQFNRQLIFRLALEVGMPRRMLEPYMRYVDSLLIRYQVGCTIGECHSDICSLPQGCPFSIVMVALLMVPWVKQMHSIEVVPRVLADDLMFTASGSGHRTRIIRAMQASKTFFR